VALPPDDHNHSEWSWDAIAGSMEGSCARAVELGLPSIAFTEHFDHSRWRISPPLADPASAEALSRVSARLASLVAPDGCFSPTPFDSAGYLDCIERCRATFPTLRIVSGVELGEPHWHSEQARRLLAGGAFERVLGSLHTLKVGEDLRDVYGLFRDWPASEGPGGVVRAYMAEILRMIESSSRFEVLAHLDYAARRWPVAEAGPCSPADFEDEYRAVLRALGQSGRVLEVNTRLPLDPLVVRWWHEVGGEAVSFGSDAHLPSAVAAGFVEAAAMVEAQGFRPGKAPHDFWRRALVG